MPTEILRPDADDSTVGAPGSDSGVPGTPYWSRVDESSADDADYVRTNNGTVIFRWTLSNTALTTETITGVDVLHRANPTTDIVNGTSQGGVRNAAGTNSWGTLHDGGSGAYTDFTDTSIARPGGGTWVVSDLDGLKGIIAMDPRDDGEGPLNTNCSQYYVTVNYTSGGGGGAEPAAPGAMPHYSIPRRRLI